MDDQAECVQPPENYQSPIDGTILTASLAPRTHAVLKQYVFSAEPSRHCREMASGTFNMSKITGDLLHTSHEKSSCEQSPVRLD